MITAAKQLTDFHLRRRYNEVLNLITRQVASVHGHLTAADIEARDELKAEMIERGLNLAPLPCRWHARR
jgi:hypothetical protein